MTTVSLVSETFYGLNLACLAQNFHMGVIKHSISDMKVILRWMTCPAEIHFISLEFYMCECKRMYEKLQKYPDTTPSSCIAGRKEGL